MWKNNVELVFVLWCQLRIIFIIYKKLEFTKHLFMKCLDYASKECHFFPVGNKDDSDCTKWICWHI